MRSPTIVCRYALIALIATLVTPAVAQEGHPLTGTWYGEYAEGSQKRDLTVIMKWDGRSVSGTINPGPASVAMKTVVLNITPGKPAPEGQSSTQGIPPVFHVRFEVDMPGAAGAPARGMVFEGTIENPVAGNRKIVGMWSRGSERGPFQLQRY